MGGFVFEGGEGEVNEKSESDLTAHSSLASGRLMIRTTVP
jgi:hypothetical protein